LSLCNQGSTLVGPQEIEKKAGLLAPAKLRFVNCHGSASFCSSIFNCFATHPNGEIVNHRKEFHFEEDDRIQCVPTGAFRLILLAGLQYSHADHWRG